MRTPTLREVHAHQMPTPANIFNMLVSMHPRPYLSLPVHAHQRDARLGTDGDHAKAEDGDDGARVLACMRKVGDRNLHGRVCGSLAPSHAHT